MTALKLAAAALIVGVALPAAAASFDFANLTWDGATNSGFLPLDGISCTGGDLCSSDVDGGTLNGDLTFSSGGITLAATGFYLGTQHAVVQDKENGYDAAAKIGAGLGVYHESGNTSDDNVTSGEKLVITFDQVVTLSSISLRAEGHNVTGWIAGATFLFNGANMLLPAGSGDIALGLVGSVFTFEFGGAVPDQFYLSGLTAVPIPEPGSLALMLGGLAAAGFVARRRRA